MTTKKHVCTIISLHSFSIQLFVSLGLLNLRGSDFEFLPVFFAYAIITENETHLYLMKKERAATNKIDNHFQTEHIDIMTNEYNDTLAGINLVVSDNFFTTTTKIQGLS